MKTLSKLLALSLVASIASTASAGEIIFNDAANAKIARLKTKARVLKNTRQQDVVDSALGAEAEEGAQSVGRLNCGSIDIANQAPPRAGRAPRATEVFILGDVINTGNKCN